ncbi:MAG: hypothetical protein E7413_00625 [Ruminococcaceae bacterium]|nr:hypothetical protein [Oscillospiraceae bacterium]
MKKLKHFIGEFKKGYIYCIAGRPGMRKTMFLKEIIKDEKDKKITVFSLETKREKFMAGLENHKNITVYDTIRTIEDIEKVLWESKPEIAAIDCFQLLNCEGNNFDEIYAVASIQLKKLSKKLGIPIIIVSQIGRECEKRIDKRPRLDDFRYTSYRTLLQDVDCIMFLYNDHYYDWAKESKQEIIIVKNRGGEIGTIVEKTEKE